MNLETCKEFFTQLFSSMNTEDSATVLSFLIISFLLGTIFSWLARGGTVRRLKKALKKKEADYNLLNAEMVGLKEQFELKEADLKKAQLQAEDFQLNLNAAKEENQQINERLRIAQEQFEQLLEKDQNNASVIEDLNNQILGLKSKNSQMESALEQNVQQQQQQFLQNEEEGKEIIGLKNDYEETTSRLSTLEQKLALLETENDGLKTQLSSVTPAKDLDEVKALLTKLSEENSNLKTEIHSIKANNQTQVVGVAGEEMQAVINRLGQLEQENKNLQNQIGNLSNTTPNNYVDLEVEEVTLDEGSSKDRANQARKELQALFGTRIKMVNEEDKDDLQNINGIGPFIEEKLNDIGIYTFEQISQLDAELIQVVTDAIEFFPGRIQRDDWVGQAKAHFTRRG